VSAPRCTPTFFTLHVVNWTDAADACVRYVWFDALTNYLTGCTYPDGERKAFWPANVHIIGASVQPLLPRCAHV